MLGSVKWCSAYNRKMHLYLGCESAGVRVTLATALQCLQSPVLKSFSHVESVALNYNSDGNPVIGKKSVSNTENNVIFLNFK